MLKHSTAVESRDRIQGLANGDVKPDGGLKSALMDSGIRPPSKLSGTDEFSHLPAWTLASWPTPCSTTDSDGRRLRAALGSPRDGAQNRDPRT